MKLTKTASGKQTIKMSKKEWEAIGKTANWRDDDPLSPVQINKNIDEFMTTHQSQDPSQPNFAVDLRSPVRAIPPKNKRGANNILHEVGLKKWKNFPVDEIFNACKLNGIIPLQEDGTEWGGMMTSQGECGHGKPSIKIQLAIDVGDGFVPAKNELIISACTLGAGSIEIVTYIG